MELHPMCVTLPRLVKGTIEKILNLYVALMLKSIFKLYTLIISVKNLKNPKIVRHV
jgi:hypothetical protein